MYNNNNNTSRRLVAYCNVTGGVCWDQFYCMKRGKTFQSKARSYLLEHYLVFSRRKLRNNGNWQPFHYPRQQQPPRDFQNSSRCQHVLLHHPAFPTSSRVRGLPSLPLLPSSLGYFCRWSFTKSKDSQDHRTKSWSVCQRTASRLLFRERQISKWNRKQDTTGLKQSSEPASRVSNVAEPLYKNTSNKTALILSQRPHGIPDDTEIYTMKTCQNVTLLPYVDRKEGCSHTLHTQQCHLFNSQASESSSKLSHC